MLARIPWALPTAFRGRLLGARWGRVLRVCIGSVRGVPSFQERDGGGHSLHTSVFVQDFPLLRPAYMWDMCGTHVGHVRAAIFDNIAFG